MNAYSTLIFVFDATTVVILVLAPSTDEVIGTVADMDASVTNLTAEAKKRSSAKAKSGSSRTYYRVDVFDQALTVKWLLEHGHEDCVIFTEPRPNKTMVMRLLKAGIEIPGSCLSVSRSEDVV
ncbi:MAG: hypothetical protein II897_05810 [Clostridia bacterium]|nr:hypothetical protein [Clostridia bacterium]